MAKKNYDELSSRILDLVGGKGNVTNCTHCVTRLRFYVKDRSLVNVDEINKISGVLGTQWFSDQLQIIIGPEVDEVYKQVCKVCGFAEEAAIDENLDGDLSGKKSVKQIASDILIKISNAFVALLPGLTACGMCTTLRLILVNFKVLPSDNPTIVFMNSIGNIIFYFMPFFVAVETAKQFKVPTVYGILIAGSLLEPNIAAKAGDYVQFFFMKIPVFGYSSSILPALLCVIIFSYLYHWIEPKLPRNFRTLLMGLISCVIIIPIMLWILAPIGYKAGIVLANTIQGFYDKFGILAAALFTGFLSFIIMTGMHHTINTVFVTNFATLGYCPIKPALLLNNLCVAGSTLGYAMHIKDKDARAACIADGVMGIFGRSEPALYGFGFKYRTPLFGNVIGGLVAGALYYALGVRQYVSAPGNIFSLPSYLTSKENFTGMLISVIVAFCVSFAVSLIMGRKDANKDFGGAA